MKINPVRLSFLFITFLFFATPITHAEEPTSEPAFHLLQFDAGLNSAFESGGFNTYSGIIRWTPEYRLNETWSVGFDAGFTDFKYSDTTHSAVIEYALSGEFRYHAYGLKLYAGAQTWTGGVNKTAFMMGPEFEYAFSKPLLTYLTNIFVSYTPTFQSLTTVHEIAVGIGFGL